MCNGNCKCRSKKELNVKIKYFEGAEELIIDPNGDCIDVYANADVFIPYMGYAMIPLGFAMELPEGKNAKLYPRSSTFKTWGVIQTNSVAIIDSSYCGDGDEWHMPLQCTMPMQNIKTEISGRKVTLSGTWIKRGDKIGQFEICDVPTHPTFTVVDKLEGDNRGGFGTSGNVKKVIFEDEGTIVTIDIANNVD